MKRECKIPDSCNYSSNSNNVPSFYIFLVHPPPPPTPLPALSRFILQQGVSPDEQRLVGAALHFPEAWPPTSLPCSSRLTQCHQGLVLFRRHFEFISADSSHPQRQNHRRFELGGNCPVSHSAPLPLLPPQVSSAGQCQGLGCGLIWHSLRGLDETT